jgi:hypothetical protein
VRNPRPPRTVEENEGTERPPQPSDGASEALASSLARVSFCRRAETGARVRQKEAPSGEPDAKGGQASSQRDNGPSPAHSYALAEGGAIPVPGNPAPLAPVAKLGTRASPSAGRPWMCEAPVRNRRGGFFAPISGLAMDEILL